MPSPILKARVSQELLDQVEAAAKGSGQTLSDWVRAVLERAVEPGKRATPTPPPNPGTLRKPRGEGDVKKGLAPGRGPAPTVPPPPAHKAPSAQAAVKASIEAHEHVWEWHGMAGAYRCQCGAVDRRAKDEPERKGGLSQAVGPRLVTDLRRPDVTTRFVGPLGKGAK